MVHLFGQKDASKLISVVWNKKSWSLEYRSLFYFILDLLFISTGVGVKGKGVVLENINRKTAFSTDFKE